MDANTNNTSKHTKKKNISEIKTKEVSSPHSMARREKLKAKQSLTPLNRNRNKSSDFPL